MAHATIVMNGTDNDFRLLHALPLVFGYPLHASETNIGTA